MELEPTASIVTGIQRARLDGVHALIVDDEFIIALEIESLLLDAGATIAGVCTTLAEALACAGESTLSIATLDIRIGKETSAAIAAKLFARGVPFVFFSGQALPSEMQGRWPDSPLVAKPASQGELVQALAELAAPETR
jgi:CheY-like chemotaxis protein